MRLLFTICVLLLMSIIAKAQNYIREFGKIGPDEIKLTEYALDKSAEAVVLFDIGSSKFVDDAEGGFDVLFERTTRIKILSEAGLDQAEFEIWFYHEGNIYEEIEGIKANVYNFDAGKLTTTQFEKGKYHDEKVNEYWSKRKIALPNVKVGSVIEYKYKIYSQYVFKLRDWEFQRDIPTMYSEYNVSMVPFYVYTFLMQGASKFHQQEQNEGNHSRNFAGIEFKDLNNRYVMVDVPAFKDEEYITSVDDYIMKIDFQLSKIIHPNGTKKQIITTWPEMAKSLLKHQDFGKYVKRSHKFGAKLLPIEELTAKPEKERFNEVVRYVKSNYNCNRKTGMYALKTVGDFNKDKFGNVADINLFTVGLLRAVGIEAYPVIISTRRHGKIKADYPFAHFFNYTLVSATVDDKVVLADATEVLAPNNMIPSRCLNERGLIIKEGEVEQWVNLNVKSPSLEKSYFQIKLSDTVAKTDMKIVSNRYYGLYMRNNYGEKIEKITEQIKDNGYELLDSTIQVENNLEYGKPYVLQYSIETNVDTLNNKIYVAPFLNEPMAENNLKQKKRTYPVDFTFPKARVYYSSLNIPKGYEVDFIPQNQKIKNNLFEMNYVVNNDGANISVSFSYSFYKSTYYSSEYSRLKFFMGELVKKGNEKIVFKKINPNFEVQK